MSMLLTADPQARAAGDDRAVRRHADRTPPADHLFRLIPEDAGRRLQTARGAVVHAQRPPGPQGYRLPHHLAIVLLSPARLQASLGTRAPQEVDAARGTLILHPVGADGHITWLSRREKLLVAWPPETLGELAARDHGAGPPGLLPPPLGTVDQRALRIAQFLRDELANRDRPNGLYVDSLITLLGIHLLRQYSGAARVPTTARGGLSAGNARRLRDHLEARFAEDVSVGELAAVAGMSPRHFLQAFTRTFGEPPHRYLIGMRLAHAERLLRTGDLPIAEIAYRSGFSSQSHLTTSMKKHRQATPLQIRRER
ncbi:AraC family transcriptional regulator [Inquilinus sp.]|uniref:AraC family transcriptional regulator n=1 Tax=Inquilinus sp. TaxID=1932117 RepID=UPI0031DDE52C